MFNGLSLEIVDPFYPAVYGGCEVASECVESLDECLGHPANGHHHYHSMSPCIVDPSITPSNLRTDAIEHMQAGWESVPDRGILGLTKDGRPLYTPYHSGG